MKTLMILLEEIKRVMDSEKNKGDICDMSDRRLFTYRIYGSETVIYDRKGKRVMGCPTEQEALEAIQRMTCEIEGSEMCEVRRMENRSEDSET